MRFLNIRKNIVRRRSIQTGVRFLRDLFENASIHGLNHLARSNIHWLEFSFWILTIVSMTTGAIYLSVDLIAQYKRENVVVTIDDNFMVFNSTKPSFTFCPYYVLDDRKIDRYIREKNITAEVSNEDVAEFLRQLSHMTISTIKPLKDRNYGISPNDYMELMFNLSRSDILREQNFQLIRTISDVGICYTHNNVLISDGTSAAHWGDRSPSQIAEKKPHGLLNFNYFDKFPENQFLVYGTPHLHTYIHSPYEMPTTWTRIAGGLEHTFLVSIQITEVTYDSNLITDATIEQRQCRTTEESNLRMFPKTYSQYLCLMECRAQFALRHCQCLPHFYGRMEFRKSQQMKICDVKGLICLAKYNEELRNLQNSKEGPFKCSCLPNCNLLGVGTYLHAKRLNFEGIAWLKIVHAHIEKRPRQQYRRSIIFTTMDFAVAIGNVLGVFLGCCILSFVEIVYFFSLRVFWFRQGYRGAIGWIRH